MAGGRSRRRHVRCARICLCPPRRTIAFLQYTSGSTSEPKGVAVSHANLLANLEMIRLSLGNSSSSTYVNWVPLYHDMGLILNALQALYVGAPCVLMAPNGFMQRPLNWLRAIHHYKAEVACSPNFGFDLCVSRYRAEQMEGVDLSSWKIALNGAEPVRARDDPQIHRHLCPARLQARSYVSRLWHGRGDAADLRRPPRRRAISRARVSQVALQAHRVGPPDEPADAQTVVGCGRALQGERIAIVDPDTRRRLPSDRVGEIWVERAERRARLLAQRGGDRDRPARPDRRRGRRRIVAAHRRSRLSRRDWRIVRHRADQGPDHHPRHQSLPAGHRADGAAPAPLAAPERRSGVLRRRTRTARRPWRSSRRSNAPSATGSILRN